MTNSRMAEAPSIINSLTLSHTHMHIIFKMLKMKNKEKILKVLGCERDHVTEEQRRIIADFLL